MDRVRMLMFVPFRFSFLIPYHNTVSGRPEEDTQVKNSSPKRINTPLVSPMCCFFKNESNRDETATNPVPETD